MSTMRLILQRLRRACGKLVRWRRRCNVALLSAREGTVADVVPLLFAAEHRDGKILHPLDPSAHAFVARDHAAKGSAAAPPTSLSAVYHPNGERGRRREWHLALPDSTDLMRDATAEWKRETDTAVICWPHTDLDDDDAGAAEAKFYLQTAVGVARHQGRLERCAIVVTGIPPEAGLAHPAQVRLDVHRGVSLERWLPAALARAEGRPGEPLADPAWRRFLADKMLRSRTFCSLVADTRIAIRGSVPLFFLPPAAQVPAAVDPTRVDAAPLLRWVGRAPAQRRRLAMAIRWACLAGAVSLVVALLLFLQVPARAPVALPSLSPCARLQALVSVLEDRIGVYERIPLHWALGVLGLEAADRALRTARSSVATVPDSDEFDAWRGRLRAHVSTLHDPQASVATDTVLCLLRERARPDPASAERALPCASLGTEDRNLAILAMASCLGSLRFTSEAGGLVSEKDAVDAVRSAARSAGFEGLASQLDSLFGNGSGLATYARWQRYLGELDGGVRPILEVRAARLPDVDAVAVVTWALARLETDVGAAVERLRELAALADVEIASHRFISSAQRELAAARLREIEAEREMQVALERPLDRHWHADYAANPVGPFAATVRTGESDAACVLRVGARPGGTIWLRFNWETETHMIAGSDYEGRPCVGSPSQALVLRARRGYVQVGGKTIEFEVIGGWPQSPSQGG